jgi:cytochrome P450
VSKPSDFDPFSYETISDPYPFYETLRRDAPVHPLERAGYSLVSRYDDCRDIALAPDRFSSKLVAIVMAQSGGEPALMTIGDDAPRPVDVLAIADEPDHARQRALSNKAFSRSRVTELHPTVCELADELLAPVLEAGRVDWIQSFADELPVRLICRLLGLPENDRAQLRTWANDGSALLSGVLDPDRFVAYAGSVGELTRYLAARFEDARRAPGNDVLGDFARVMAREPARLSDDEVVSILLQLLSAGTESTTALLGSAIKLLVNDDDLQALLRERPGFIGRFVEEAVRLESPFQGHFRVANRDETIAGTRIAAGTRLMLLWGSANRDERRFERPLEVDVHRSNLNMHLGFGFGIHHCIGAGLARMEARVAIERLLERTRKVRAVSAAPAPYVQSVMIRRLERFDIDVEPV